MGLIILVIRMKHKHIFVDGGFHSRTGKDLRLILKCAGRWVWKETSFLRELQKIDSCNTLHKNETAQ